jgi:hypothetical protein
LEHLNKGSTVMKTLGVCGAVLGLICVAGSGVQNLMAQIVLPNKIEVQVQPVPGRVVIQAPGIVPGQPVPAQPIPGAQAQPVPAPVRPVPAQPVPNVVPAQPVPAQPFPKAVPAPQPMVVPATPTTPAITTTPVVGTSTTATATTASADEVAVRAATKTFAETFNKGQVTPLVAAFLPNGEYVDESGTIYQGSKELTELLTAYFKKFPGVQVSGKIESVRVIGPLAIEEGVRVLTTKESATQIRYIATYVKNGGIWQIASLRDFSEDAPASPHEQLQPLSWLIGDWVNEGTDAKVKINYTWDEDKNYILGKYEIHANGKLAMKSSHRIGFDPLTGKIRSWLFDTDGGFAEGSWTQVGDEWIIKSSVTMPDGQTGSSTIRFIPKTASSFAMKGTDRIVGNEAQDDFEVTIVKAAPAATR